MAGVLGVLSHMVGKVRIRGVTGVLTVAVAVGRSSRRELRQSAGESSVRQYIT